MPHSTRQIANVPIATGTGSQTINVPLDAMDLSMAKSMEAILTITTAATVVGSTLDVKLQMATFVDPAGNQVWDTRIRFSPVPGNTTASAASPYQEGANLSQDVDLTTSERNYRPTGSNGGTELNPGTVRDGVFPAFLRAGLLNNRQANVRMQAVVVDVAGTANFVGSLLVYAHLWSAE